MIGKESRFNYAASMRIVSPAGFLLEPEHRDIRPTMTRIVYPDNRQYVPQPSDNWSNIAWRAYGDGKRWWVIADFSGVVDPLSELHTVARTSYVAQLSADVPAGTVLSIHVDRPSRIARAMKLRVENLDPSNPDSFETSVIDVNQTTGLVNLVPSSVGGGVPAALSRVSRIYDYVKPLIVPTVHRALFEALDFNNPLNVLVD